MYTIYYYHEDQPENSSWSIGVSSPVMSDCLEDAGDAHKHGVKWYILDSQGRPICDSEDVS